MRLNLLALILMFLLAVPAVADEAETPSGPPKWEFAYKPDHEYTYKLATTVDYKFQHMSAQSGYNGRLGKEIHYLFNIDSELIFDIKKVSKKGDAEAEMRFEGFRMKLGYREDTPKELNGSKPSNAEPGDLKEVLLEDAKLSKMKIKVLLPSHGGVVIKDKMKDFQKLFSKTMKKMDKHRRNYAKDYKELLTPTWWQKFLSNHFLPLDKKAKVPGEGKMDLCLFLGGNPSIASSVAARPVKMKYVEMKRSKLNGRVDLGIRFDIDIKEGIFNYSQLITHHKTAVFYSLDPAGHLQFGPYEVRLANYSGDASQGDEYLIEIKSTIDFKKVEGGPSSSD